LHNRLWQQDQEREPQYSQATASEPQAAQAGTANGTTEPTLWSGASEAQNQQSAAEHISIDTSSPLPASEQRAQDITDIPTAHEMPSHEDENVLIPPSPPVSQTDMASVSAEPTQAASPPLPSPQSSEATG